MSWSRQTKRTSDIFFRDEDKNYEVDINLCRRTIRTTTLSYAFKHAKTELIIILLRTLC